jgi:hypothetical protein
MKKKIELKSLREKPILKKPAKSQKPEPEEPGMKKSAFSRKLKPISIKK